MTCAKFGLILNAIGGAMVAVTGYKGLAAGFGGPIVWTSSLWHCLWWLGWVLLVVGFVFQLFD